MDYIPLRMGAMGPVVGQMQRALEATGYPLGKIDGNFGLKTLRAVISFQKDHQLPVDGVVAANTWMMIEKLSGIPCGGQGAEPAPDPPREHGEREERHPAHHRPMEHHSKHRAPHQTVPLIPWHMEPAEERPAHRLPEFPPMPVFAEQETAPEPAGTWTKVGEKNA